MSDNRHRIPVDFRPSPLAREREGCRLTERSITSRLCEVVERLDRIVDVTIPRLTDDEWSLVCWSGWSAIESERIIQRGQPQQTIDAIAWMQLVTDAAEHLPDLAPRLQAMTSIERVAVLERIEAYGRALAMEGGAS